MSDTNVLNEQKITEKERLYFLDLIKTIAIFIVCFYHYNNLKMDFLQDGSFFSYFNYFLQSIFSICVPLFFLVNGYLYLNSRYDIKKHVRKTLKILILTLFWSFASVLIVGHMLGHKYNLINFIMAGYFLEYKVADHLWFLQTLFCIYLFFPVIKPTYDEENKTSFYLFLGTLFLLTFVGVFFDNLSDVFQIAVGVNKLPEGHYFLRGYNPFLGFKAYNLVYFLIGGLLKKYIDEKETYKKWFSAKLLVPIFIVSASITFFYGVYLSNFNNSTYDNVWTTYNTIMTLLMSLSVFLLCCKIKYNNEKINSFLKLVGSNTLGIFILHRIPGVFFAKYFSLMPHNDNCITNALFAALIMMVSLGMVLLIKRIPVLKKSVEL